MMKNIQGECTTRLSNILVHVSVKDGVLKNNLTELWAKQGMEEVVSNGCTA